MRENIIKSLMLVIVTGITVAMFFPCEGEAEERRLVLSTMDFEPYFAEHLPDGGPLTEITKKAFRQVGYDAEVKFVPWKRALVMSERGEYDGLLGPYYSEERSRSFTYTEKLAETKIVLVTRKGRRIAYASLDDLKPYSIGIIRAVSISQEFDTAAYLRKVELDGQEQGIRMLMLDRIDLLAVGKIHLSQILSKHPDWTGSIEIINPPLQVKGLFNAISKQVRGHESIVSDFNRGLKKIQKNGMFEQIMRKHGINEYR